jgi:Ca2+-binding EF-hand superfamily protein
MAEGLSPSDAKTRRAQRFQSDYGPKLKAMDEEYWQTIARGRTPKNNLAAFEKQKQYLKDNNPFDSREFVQMFIFGFKDYSKTQALEIQPLLGAYKSNLVVQVEELPDEKKGRLKIGIIQVGQVEANVGRILNPPAPKPKVETAQNTNPPPVNVARPKAAPKIPEAPVEIVTNILLVKENLKIPLEQIRATDIHNLTINSTRWSDGKLILDLRFSATVDDGASPPVMPISGDNNMRVIPIKITGGTPQVAFAVFDSTNGKWGTTFFPERFAGSGAFRLFSWNKSGLCCELFQGNFYLSEGGQVKKYDFKARQWETLNLPSQNNSQLYAVAGRLFTASDESIIEITDGGKGTRILAGTRRRPAASTLDSLGGLGSPVLFSGLNRSLCAIVGKKVFSWDGNDWREVFTLNFSQPPEVFEDAVIFRSISSVDPANLWISKKDQSEPELCLHDEPKPHPGVSVDRIFNPNDSALHPLWKSPIGDYLASSAATSFKSNLYFFVDHAIVTNVSGHWTVAEKNGYHAKLVCLSRDFPEPIVVPLKFDLAGGRPPLKSFGEKFQSFPRLARSTWMIFAGDKLYIGQPDVQGIWAVTISEIETAVAAQKQIQLGQQAQATATAEQTRKNLLVKYDRNHNRIIDPEEKEEALDDSAFIESELDAIDANQNGRLDPAEFVYFDANTNKILEAKEQAGIDIAQRLLAAKLFKKFDVNGDGLLDRPEFIDLWQSGLRANTVFMPSSTFPFPDENHDSQVDIGELGSLLKQLTRNGLRPQPGSPAFLNQMRADPSKPIDPQQLFKSSVEGYWQNPGGNRVPSSRVSPGGGVTNGTQSGKAQ